jgi:hypothetical protein
MRILLALLVAMVCCGQLQTSLAVGQMTENDEKQRARFKKMFNLGHVSAKN